MTTEIEQLQKQHDDLKADFAKYCAHFEKHRALQQVMIDKLTKPAAPFVPGVGDGYHFADGAGGIQKSVWKNDAVDLARLAMGNVYCTQADAERYVAWRKVDVRLRGLTKGFVPDWTNANQRKARLVRNNDTEAWFVIEDGNYQTVGAMYFPSVPDAMAAVAEIGEDGMAIWLGGA